MTIRLFSACFLLVSSLVAVGSVQADHGDDVRSLTNRLHAQANVVEAEIQGDFRRSPHYFELKQAGDVLHHQVDELRDTLRSGGSPWQLRRDAAQVNQAINQLDRLLEHVIVEHRTGAVRLACNPDVLHRRLHQMQGLSQELLTCLPSPTTTFRPTWGSGYGYGGYGVSPQPGFSFGGGSGFYLGGRNWGIQFGR